MANPKNTIFLCHASEDKDIVLRYYKILKGNGLSPWIDKEDLLPGQNWDKEIRRVIRASRFMIIFFSNNSVSKRGYVQKEFKMGLDVMDEMPENEVFTIPVRLNKCNIPNNFSHIHYTDLFEENDFNKILKVIRYQLGDTKLKEESSTEKYSIIESESFYYKGNYSFDRKKYFDAISNYEKVIKINPKFENALYNKAYVLYKVDKFEEAIKAFDQALRVNPDQVDALINKGQALHNLGRFNEAIEIYNKIITKNPNYLHAYNNIGVAFGELNNIQESIKWFDKAIKINSEYSEAHGNKGFALEQLKKYSEAIKSYEEAVFLNPKDFESYERLGVVFNKLSQREKAEEAINKANLIKSILDAKA